MSPTNRSGGRSSGKPPGGRQRGRQRGDVDRGGRARAGKDGGRRGAAGKAGGRQGAAGRGAAGKAGGRRGAAGKVAAVPAGRRARAGSGGTRGLGGDQVEGRQAVRELLLAGARRVREVWMVDERDEAPILRDIVELAEAARVPVRAVGRSRFAAQARCEAPQGVLALAAPLHEVDIDDLVAGAVRPPGGGVRGAPFLVALDGVTDPGNLGAVLRSAECAGVTGVVLPRHRAVHVTPAATKAAAGAVEHLPMAVVGGLASAVSRMRDAGVHVVGLDGAATASLYDLVPADGPVCLVLGAEGRGLSRLVRERCDQVVAIPMAGRLGSLNVAAAAALACFEIARQR